MPHFNAAVIRAIVLGLVVLAMAAAAIERARAEALLLTEARTGKVLHAENATQPWYPASLTKLMTSYVTLRAVKDGRIKLDTLFMVSRQAAAQQPSKMGFPVGTRLTVDNALKMLLVRSANDMAVVLAEGIAGSVADFAVQMNGTALRLGMTQSNFVNPNGLPNDAQVTSARDMAILARALILEFPEYNDYWSIPAIKFGRRVMRNYNRLIGRYPGADGMKTGFICASGFNLVASATRNGRRLIAVVLGAPSSRVRAYKAAQLLEKGFSGSLSSWLTPSLGTVHALVPLKVAPVNLRNQVCGGDDYDDEEDEEENKNKTADAEVDADSPFAVALSHLRAPATDVSAILSRPAAAAVPVVVRVIPPPRKPNADDDDDDEADSKSDKKKNARTSNKRSKSRSNKKRRRARQ